MKTRMLAMLIFTLGSIWASTAEGQPLREVFKQVNPSVVVIRASRSTRDLCRPGFRSADLTRRDHYGSTSG